MSFWKSFERNILRPIGRGAKAVAPIAGTIAGTAVGGPMGGALGNTLGGMAQRGKVDLGKDAMNFGGGLLMGGVAGKLGIPGMGGKGTPDIGTFNPKAMITGVGEKFTTSPTFMQQAGNFLKDGKNLRALGDTALGGMNALQQERQLRLQREDMERRQRMEDEDRQRRQAMDPMRAELLSRILARMGGSPMAGMEG